MACLFINNVIDLRGLFFGENITKLVFEMLRASLLEISHVLSFLSSLFIIDSIDYRLGISKENIFLAFWRYVVDHLYRLETTGVLEQIPGEHLVICFLSEKQLLRDTC